MKYLYKDLTEQIIAAGFCVYRELGYGKPEKVYQKAIEVEFEKRNLAYEKEKYGRILFDGVMVGRYFLDFLVEGKVAVELKVRREVYESDWVQLLNYLKSKNLKLGLLLVFTKYGIKIKRVANDPDIPWSVFVLRFSVSLQITPNPARRSTYQTPLLGRLQLLSGTSQALL